MERLLQDLGLDVYAGTFASADVEWEIFVHGRWRCVSSRSARRGDFKAAGRSEATGTDRPEAAEGGSFTALATQHHALATVKVDSLPTAQRLTSGKHTRSGPSYGRRKSYTQAASVCNAM